MLINSLSNLGPIKESKTSIELKPLTIFMGDNSSGKTLVASIFFHQIKVIHYLKNMLNDEKILKSELLEIDPLKNLKEKIIKKVNLDESEASYDFILNEFSDSEYQEIFQLQTNLMNMITGHIIKKDYKSIFRKKTKVTFEFNLKESYENEIKINISDENVKIIIDKKTLTVEKDNLESLAIKTIVFWFKTYISKLYSEEYYTELAYIPAARTGLIKAYNALVDSKTSEKSYERFDFTVVEKFFVSQLLYRKKTVENIVVDYIEKFIFNGKVNLENDEKFSLLVKKKNIDSKLFSSTLTEILPLIIFLKKGFIKKGSFLVIEEPEAHLSFKNQELILNVIIKLIQNKTKVLLTTHSEYLIYTLNNLIKLNTIKNKLGKVNTKDLTNDEKKLHKKLVEKVKNKEYINHESINVYNFKYLRNNKSIIEKVDISKLGIHNDYLNQLNFNLLEENNLLMNLME